VGEEKEFSWKGMESGMEEGVVDGSGTGRRGCRIVIVLELKKVGASEKDHGKTCN